MNTKLRVGGREGGREGGEGERGRKGETVYCT